MLLIMFVTKYCISLIHIVTDIIFNVIKYKPYFLCLCFYKNTDLYSTLNLLTLKILYFLELRKTELLVCYRDTTFFSNKIEYRAKCFYIF